MNVVTALFQTSIGKKWIVALTGLVLVGYVVGHMAGNLQIFAGPEQINAYAKFLHSMPAALWVVRIFLIVAFVLHIVMTIKLAAENRAARGGAYQKRNRVQSKLATRTMVMSGLIVLAFVAFHLADFTVRATDPRYLHLPHGEYDVHTMVIYSFQKPIVSGFYILAVFLLCLHLSHGLQSVMQTLGLNSEKVRKPLGIATQSISWLIFAGYVAVPAAVLTNVLKVVP